MLQHGLRSPVVRGTFLLSALTVLWTIVQAGTVGADTFTWTRLVEGDASGSWAEAANWNNGAGPVASGADNVADFSSLELTVDSTVTLDGSQTIGHLIFGDLTASNNWTLATGSGGPLTLAVSSGSPSIQVVNQVATVSAQLSGTAGLSKTGAGTLVLTNTANGTLSGHILIQAGVLRAGTALSSGNVTINGVLGAASSGGANLVYVQSGGTFQLASRNRIYDKQFRISGDGVGGVLGAIYADVTGGGSDTRLGVGGSSALDPFVTLDGDATIRVDGAGSGNATDALLVRSVGLNGFTLRKTGTGRLHLDQTSVGLSGSGTVRVVEGTLSFRGGAFGGSRNLIVEAGAQAWITGDNNALNSTVNTVEINGTLILNSRTDTTGFSQRVGQLLGAGTITTGTFGNTGTQTLTVASVTADSVFSGVIREDNGVINLVKAGAGTTLTLSGANTYRGTTTVSEGQLLVNGSHTGAGSYSVAAGARLGGSGLIQPAGSAGITVSGVLAPGASLGTLTIDSGASSAGAILTLSSGATLVFELGAGTLSDQVAIVNASVGDVVFTNNVLNLIDTTAGALSGPYKLFTADAAGAYAGLSVDGEGNITGGLVIGTGLENYPGSKLMLVGNDILLVVPEPATLGLLAMGGWLMLGGRKNKKA